MTPIAEMLFGCSSAVPRSMREPPSSTTLARSRRIYTLDILIGLLILRRRT